MKKKKNESKWKNDWQTSITIIISILTFVFLLLFQYQNTTSKFSISGKYLPESGIEYEPLYTLYNENAFENHIKVFNLKKNSEKNFSFYKWITVPILLETIIVNERNNSFSIIDYNISDYNYKKDIKFILNDSLKKLFEYNGQSGIIDRQPIFFGPNESKILKFQFNFPIIPNDISSLNYLDTRTRKHCSQRELEECKTGNSTFIVRIYNKEIDSTYYVCKEAFYDLIEEVDLKVRLMFKDNNGRTEYSDYIEIRK